MKIQLIHNLVNTKTGKTWREENMEKTHNIPLGTLVETDKGIRLWIVSHDRDCDGTPLYYLCFLENWKDTHLNSKFKLGGYSEDCLTVIKLKDEDYEKIMQRISDLMDMEETEENNKELNILAEIIIKYESIHYPIGKEVCNDN